MSESGVATADSATRPGGTARPPALDGQALGAICRRPRLVGVIRDSRLFLAAGVAESHINGSYLVVRRQAEFWPEVRFTLSEDRKTGLLRRMRRAFAWGRMKLPFGLRTVLGLLLVVGGLFGFLPVLGFWMVPLGAVLIALDVAPLRRWLREWLHRAAGLWRRLLGRTRIGQRKDDR